MDTGHHIARAGGIAWFLASLLGVSADTNGIYFLFTAQAETIKESFVLELTQPTDIEYARERIRSSVTDYLAALVNIAEGPDGINRDYLTPGAPQWSWHITGFRGFSEVVPANQTANPSEIEADVPGWIAMLQGRAAFFYDPVLELLPPPSIVLSLTSSAGTFRLSWPDLGVHYVYTVEIATSPAGTWTAASGTVWPSAVTNWMDADPPTSGVRYFRVRGQLKSP